ncbi:DUF433 domain-containing protein [Microcoleus vaginatus GB1-A2]|uniref:DUF433 domain-containing protein n=1 Tax=Microcoleus vaginatus TaxID=119532 RepID=UPI001687D300|nr:DUF433 domain-containing protein [Microcoleus sp. FACHB-61]
MDYHDIITIEPGKRSGKPCIWGRRITVYDILEYLADRMTEAEMMEDFSELSSADIKACLASCWERVTFAISIYTQTFLRLPIKPFK